MLPRLPRVTPDGGLDRLGILPGVLNRARGRGATQSAARVGGLPRTRVDNHVRYSPVLDPLTGLPSHYANPPSGYELPSVAGGSAPVAGVPIAPTPWEMTDLITEAVRTLELSPEEPVGNVIEAINASEYGGALNRLVGVVRG